jgi:hypothetical protein
MRRLSVLLVALLAAIGASALIVSMGSGSSHREAPLTSIDPTADDTDLYAFTADDAKDSLTVVANWIPFEDPAGGPNFYGFDPKADYYVNIDNTGDGNPDVRYQWKFRTEIGNPNSFLYALPGVSSITDSKLNVKQFYTLKREAYNAKGKLVDTRTLLTNAPVAPNNVGPKTFPDYASVAAQAIKDIPGGGKSFSGQVDDPFFVDLGATFDAINLRLGLGNEGGGKDDLAGYNVHTVVLQVPEEDVTKDAQPVDSASSSNAVVGVWSSTERRAVFVHGPRAASLRKAAKKAHARRAHRKSAHRAQSGRGPDDEVQVSRLGNPLVNEVVIPLGMKDYFNATQPADDGANFGQFVVKPELAAVINALFGTTIQTDNRTDIVTALLTGIPGLTRIAPGAPPTDTLKVNLGVDPAASPNRFGVLANDAAGFPNGRRLGDDVTDIELRVIGGFLLGNKLPLGDGVDQNDVPFRTTFPYVAPPHDGFSSDPKRIEPTHPGTPGQP